MANIILGAVAPVIVDKVGELIKGKLAEKAKITSPTPAPLPSKVIPAVVEAISESEDVAVVPVKPAAKDPVNWGAIFGALSTIAVFYGGDLIPARVLDAVDTIGQAIHLPPKIAPAILIVGSFGFIAVRKTFFSHSITPAAADRGSAQGKVI